jgi:hypothetical protein
MSKLIESRAWLMEHIKAHVEAQIEWANHGCQSPEDWPAIEADAKDARHNLEMAIQGHELVAIKNYVPDDVEIRHAAKAGYVNNMIQQMVRPNDPYALSEEAVRKMAEEEWAARLEDGGANRTIANTRAAIAALFEP